MSETILRIGVSMLYKKRARREPVSRVLPWCLFQLLLDLLPDLGQ